MKFTEQYTLTSHDTDSLRAVRPSVLLRLMQETANHSMRDEGESYDHLFDRGLSFVLADIHVRCYATLRQYENVTVETWAGSDSKGVRYNRYYRILRGDGTVADACSTWAVIDLDHDRRLVRIAENEFTYSMDEPLERPPRLRLPRDIDYDAVGEFTVGYRDADINRHMNNTNYPDVLCGFIPDFDMSRLKSFAIRFTGEAKLGESVAVTMGTSDGRYCFKTHRISDNAENIEAEFTIE